MSGTTSVASDRALPMLSTAKVGFPFHETAEEYCTTGTTFKLLRYR